MIELYVEEGALPLHQVAILRQVLDRLAADEHYLQPTELSVVFLNDDEMLQLNKQYLDHDHHTDVITFSAGADPDGNALYEACIGIQQVERQAEEHGVDKELEVSRMIIHAALHMIGYNDSNNQERQGMQLLEDQYLSLVKVPRGTRDLENEDEV